ncbi:MAG: M20/M25/M40 family metallo-hydrolase [Clostridia bacterium]|nr:M20/M25/M40 family metallo-hydrolase [Clostridia bacterium]
MIAFIIILFVVLAFLLYLFIKMNIAASKAPKLQEGKNYYSEEEINKYAQDLGKMIRCKTVSVKDSYEDSEFKKLRETVEELFPLFHKRAEKLTFSEDCWIYKIEGKNKNHNIMLMSHHDVVDVSGEWEHDGFSGEIADGKIWGRGTVDTKTPLFAEFSALEELLEEGFEFPCNVYIGSSHNEELGGNGIPEANKYFKENQITFDVILDEGGALIEPPIAGIKAEKCAMIAVHEKGRYYLNCKATAANAHASLTAAGGATVVERMSAFIDEVTKKDLFIRRLNPQVRAMFSHLAPYCSFPMKLLFTNLEVFGGLLKKVMPKINAQAGGLIGTTCSFNKIEGSSEDKVCSARAFLRPVDEKDFEKDLQKFIEVAKKYAIEVEVDESSEYHAPADMSKPQFDYLKKCVNEIFPQYPVSPFILPAGTDARTLTDVCPCVLRFAPIRLSAQQLASVHAENENIDLDAVANCVKFYKHFVKNYKV